MPPDLRDFRLEKNLTDAFIECHFVAERLDSIEQGLNCAANGGYSIDFSKLPFGRANTWTFGLSGSQTLFDRKRGGQLAAADAGRDQAAIEVDAQRAASVLDVAQAYFDAQLAQRLVDIADSTLAQAQRTFEQTRLERQVGNAAEFDQLRAGVARDNQAPVVIQRRAGRDQALLRLRQVLDLPANTPLLLTTSLTDTSAVSLPPFAAAMSGDTAVAARAPVREAEAALQAGEDQLRSARAERIPTVGAVEHVLQDRLPGRTSSRSTGSSRTGRWRCRSACRSSTAAGCGPTRSRPRRRATRAMMRLKQARQQAELEQSDTRTQLASAEATFAASFGTVAQAQRAYEIAELRYRNGLSTLTDVGDARLQLGQAQANNAQAARDLQVARIRLALLRDLPFSGAAPASAGAGAAATGTTADRGGRRCATGGRRNHSRESMTMRPRLMRRSFLRAMWGAVPLLVLVLGCGGTGGDRAAAAGAAPPTDIAAENIVVVDSAVVESGPELSGTLAPDRAAQLRAQVAGAILALYVDEGTPVTAGEAVALIDTLSLAEAARSAHSQLVSAQLADEIAQRHLERYTNLHNAGAIADRDLELAHSQAVAADAAVADAQSKLTTAQKQLANATVRAPFAGMVSTRPASAGDVVQVGTPIMTVVDPRELQLEASVAAEFIGQVRIGTRVDFTVNGNAGHLFSGRVARINPTVDSVTRQVRLYVTVPNNDRALAGGLFAQGRVAMQTARGLVIPGTALDRKAPAPSVRRLRGGRVELVPVTLGLRDDLAERVEVVRGLALGDSVLVGAALATPAGATVRVTHADR